MDPGARRCLEWKTVLVCLLPRPQQLKMTGAKTAQPRQVQIAYFHEGRDVIAAPPNLAAQAPHWDYNLVANPACELGGDAAPRTEVTDPFEHTRLYRRLNTTRISTTGPTQATVRRTSIATDPMPG